MFGIKARFCVKVNIWKSSGRFYDLNDANGNNTNLHPTLKCGHEACIYSHIWYQKEGLDETFKKICLFEMGYSELPT